MNIYEDYGWNRMLSNFFRVVQQIWAMRMHGQLTEKLSSSSPLCSTATAVRVQWARRGPAGAPEVRVIRDRLCRVLPGPRPLLFLGWTDLLQILRHEPEVTRTEREDVYQPESPECEHAVGFTLTAFSPAYVGCCSKIIDEVHPCGTFQQQHDFFSFKTDNCANIVNFSTLL